MSFFDAINYAAPIAKLLFFLVNLVGLELILWMYAFNRYSRPSALFLSFTLYLLFWANADFVSALAPMFLSDSLVVDGALWATRAVLALLCVFFAAFYFFSKSLPVPPRPEEKRFVKNIHILAWAAFLVASLSPLIIKGVDLDFNRPLMIWTHPGILFWPFAIFAAISLALSISGLRRDWHLVDIDTQRRLRLVVVGAGIFGIFNLIFNIIYPVFGYVFEYGGPISIFGDYALIVFLGYAGYYSVREKLFGVKVIFVEIFAGLMGASLAVMPFFVSVFWQKALLSILFLLFCAFGYLLVKSTIKESREKEFLENKILERTKELELTKLNLEETNSVLEIRVKARTRELERLNQTLEQKVIERTNAIESKIKDLETFQRITIGRELKMIELKKENERLRVALGAAESSANIKQEISPCSSRKIIPIK